MDFLILTLLNKNENIAFYLFHTAIYGNEDCRNCSYPEMSHEAGAHQIKSLVSKNFELFCEDFGVRIKKISFEF